MDEIDQGELREHLGGLMNDLDDRERQILEWHFGLADDSPITLEQIGQRLGLSRERVRQIEARALRRMRERCDEQSLRASLELAGPV